MIHKISAGTRRTDVKGIVDRYAGLVNPRLANDGEARFPSPMNRHAHSLERSSNTQRLSLMAFHIGNAVAMYYSFVTHPEDAPVREHLDRAMKRLRLLADAGYDGLRVVGSEQKGYLLAPLETPE